MPSSSTTKVTAAREVARCCKKQTSTSSLEVKLDAILQASNKICGKLDMMNRRLLTLCNHTRGRK